MRAIEPKTLLMGLITLAGLFGLVSNSAAVQTIQWEREAVKINLVVGVEQLVHLDGPATVGLPPALAHNDAFRHLFAADTAYWKAMRPFKNERIKVRLDQTGQMLLFDVSAVSHRKPPKSVEPIRLLAAAKISKSDSSRIETVKEERQRPTMFDLVRYAVQQDYSPTRVVMPLAGVRELDKKLAGDISALYAHRDAVYLNMKVTRSWASDGLYVSSVLVKNLAQYELTIDPSRMQHTARIRTNGVSTQFLATAMIRRVIGPKGAVSRTDQTRLYIVTDRPLGSLVSL